MGAPGAGKGTLAERISGELGIAHIATGDILRAAVEAGTKLGQEAQKYLEAGELVPDEVVNGIVGERLAQEDCVRGFLLDGFPRTVEQAKALNGILTGRGEELSRVLVVEVEPEVIVRRLSGRRVCLNCGATYQVETLPPRVEGVCDICGGKLVQRPDDQPATIRHRLVVYEEQTKPLIEYYEQQGLVTRVDNSGAIGMAVEAALAALRAGSEK
ncbi:MAG TPA: adenylate kinase [Armatimonadetes bacterium]|nr:adenylate kinase [Armatimonadota bacterium]